MYAYAYIFLLFWNIRIHAHLFDKNSSQYIDLDVFTFLLTLYPRRSHNTFTHMSYIHMLYVHICILHMSDKCIVMLCCLNKVWLWFISNKSNIFSLKKDYLQTVVFLYIFERWRLSFSSFDNFKLKSGISSFQ